MSASTSPSAAPARSGAVSPRVARPTSADEAVGALADGDRTVVAGATDLMVDVHRGRRTPSALVDISRVDELRTTGVDADVVRVGAAVSAARLARADLPPALRCAAGGLGSAQIRSRATLAGNVVTGSPAGDLVPFLVASEATAAIRGARGGREVAVADLAQGPGVVALAPDELIVALRWDRTAGPQCFVRVAPRSAGATSVASCCLIIDERTRSVRLALGAVAPTVVRAVAAELEITGLLDAVGWWDGGVLAEDDTRVATAIDAAVGAARPIDDLRASADYRRHAVAVLVRRAIRTVAAAGSGTR